MSKEIQPNWYKIKGIWYHCITVENGDRYVNGEKQYAKNDLKEKKLKEDERM